MAMNYEFPTLEDLYIRSAIGDHVHLVLPKRFQAPHLRRLALYNFAFPLGPPIVTTAVGLVTLSLQGIHLSIYFHPNCLLQPLSLMPQLEALLIDFRSPVPDRDVEMHTPIMTHVILPNLRRFGFCGVSAYSEALLSQMATPFLEKFQIQFPDQPTFSVPHLPEFISRAKNLRFSGAASARMGFSPRDVWVVVNPPYVVAHRQRHFLLTVKCGHLDKQVTSVAQLFNPLKAVFPPVEGLILEYWEPTMSLEWNNEADRTQWRELFRSFSNVKTLRVDNGLVTRLSDSLRLDDGESPILPELKELSYSASCDAGDAFTAFIDARQKAGHPVTLYRF